MFRIFITNLQKVQTVNVINRSFYNTDKILNFQIEQSSINEKESLPTDVFIDENVGFKKQSVLEDCSEDLSHVAPYLKPTFNFAAYVNKSETLQQLVNLGVNLYKLERRKDDCVPFIMNLDFERDIKQYITYLDDLKIADIGKFITMNPFIFKEDIENLNVRINYLLSKKFQREMITRILDLNPNWLNFSVQEIDKKLGFFQAHFTLNGHEIRFLSIKKPTLITTDMKKIKLNDFVIRQEMGFTPEETKKILLETPQLFISSQHKILATFEYLHRDMKLSLEDILKFPNILKCRKIRLKQRHLFLEKLNKIQFDPKKPNYISILNIVSKDDATFASETAKSSIQAYNAFLKTL